MNNFITINEVGPRDGLQNQQQILSIEQRIQLISQLVEANIPCIEIGSFVSPKAVPAMAGTDKVYAALPEARASYSALIPNARGYENALTAGINSMALVLAASDTMNEKILVCRLNRRCLFAGTSLPGVVGMVSTCRPMLRPRGNVPLKVWSKKAGL